MNFLPIQKSGHSAAQTEAFRNGRVAPVVLAAIAWLVTYNKAVMCGDDVDHLYAPWGNQIFLPNFIRSWIPNRVVDLYGRNLLGRVFDVTFFPAHALTGVDFFHFYKIFNATLFTVFLLVVHRYVMAQLRQHPGLLVSLLVAFGLLLILPWTNQVRAICYQFPAFLTFVVLSEFIALLRAERPAPPPWLLAAGFVAAFSLEGYAAILFAALAVTFVLVRPSRADAAILGGLIAAFCAVALVMTVTLSQRAGVSESFAPLRQYAAFFGGGPVPPYYSLFYAKMLALGIAGLAAMAVFRRRFVALCGFGPAEGARPWALALPDAGIFALIGCVTLVVEALLSMETNENFFWFRVYPWGDLSITAMLFGLTAVAAQAGAGPNRPPLLESLRIFVLALAISRMTVAALGLAAPAFDESEKVQAGYTAALNGTKGIIPTGLNLELTEMPKRDLPTADSPDWFIADYQAVFLKYYGVQTEAVFK